jgi:phosphatidylserine/phosphatidylglycerophosphate/cardiolipin synthase-like enzyme
VNMSDQSQLRLLRSHEISTAIINLIINAKENVYLISPYVKLWNHLQQAISQALKRNVEVFVYIRADKLPDYEETCRSLLQLGASVYTVNLLHAKVYANDSECIVTSMNLLDFSASNSEEIAIHTSSGEFKTQIDEYIRDLKGKALRFQIPVEDHSRAKPISRPQFNTKTNQERDKHPGGYCIRCKEEIERNNERPFCRKCFSKWAEYKNPTYEEEYCHICGKKGDTSFAKPLCLSCFKKQG